MKYGTAGTNPAGRGVRVASDAFWGVALQLRTCAGALALGFLAAASTLVLRGQAQAQTFVYASINSLHTIPVVIDDNQWVPDIFPNGGPAGSGTGRYAPNLNMRFRIIANPRVRAAGLVYSELDLDSTTTFGVNDTVDFRWYDNTGAASTRTSGPWSPGTTTGLAFPSGSFASNSLMFPGARFTFRSGPTWNGSGTFVETEDTGLRTSGIQINGTGTMGSSSVPVLSPHERVLGVVLANDDVVDMRLPATASPATVALWLENPNTSSVKLWARCVALPSATAFDQAMSTAPASLFPTWQGASLRLPACAGGWFLSVTNTSTTDRVFHLVWGVHEAEQALTWVQIRPRHAASARNEGSGAA